jgi:hypothetical protein
MTDQLAPGNTTLQSASNVPSLGDEVPGAAIGIVRQRKAGVDGDATASNDDLPRPELGPVQEDAQDGRDAPVGARIDHDHAAQSVADPDHDLVGAVG